MVINVILYFDNFKETMLVVGRQSQSHPENIRISEPEARLLDCGYVSKPGKM
jgi:hypothetical protein